MTQRKGFTLIELLVVIAIIGILSTLAVVALNNARQKSRDAKRIADVKQIQTALELRFADSDGYPNFQTAITLGSANYDCLTSNTAGFVGSCGSDTIYMGQVPANPTPGGTDYSYCSSTSSAPTTCASSTESYMITFELEGPTGGLGDTDNNGTIECTATPSGVTCV